MGRLQGGGGGREAVGQREVLTAEGGAGRDSEAIVPLKKLGLTRRTVDKRVKARQQLLKARAASDDKVQHVRGAREGRRGGHRGIERGRKEEGRREEGGGPGGGPGVGPARGDGCHGADDNGGGQAGAEIATGAVNGS